MAYEIIEKLKREIEGYKEKPEWAEVGRVLEVGDGIVKITGLRNAVSQEPLTIETPKGARTALALSLEEESIGALVIEIFTVYAHFELDHVAGTVAVHRHLIQGQRIKYFFPRAQNA